MQRPPCLACLCLKSPCVTYLVFDLNLSQEVASPTHMHQGYNILELVLTNSPFLISDCISISSQSTYYFQSDH